MLSKEGFMFDNYSQLPALSQQNLLTEINRACKKYRANSAFNYLNQNYSFSQIDDYSANFATWLQHHTSLKPGDRIAIQLPNIIHYPIATIAAIRAGLVIVNTNPMYTETELSHQFKDGGAKALIVLDKFIEKSLNIVDETAIETIIFVNPCTLLSDEKQSAANELYQTTNKTVNILPFSDVIQHEAALVYEEPILSNDTLALLQYTGGTTGVAKGAMLSHGNIVANIYQVIARVNEQCRLEKDTLVLPLPLYHIFAFTISTMYFLRGNCSILIPNPSDLDQFVDLIKEHKFTGFAGINTLLIGLSHHQGFKALDFSALKFTITGGAATTVAAIDAWFETTHCMVSEGWGLSESSPALTLNPPSAPQKSCVGLPVIETELIIVDNAGNKVAQGEEGEVWARGPQIMQGYWQHPEASAATVTADGWLKTGDIGYLQKDGFLKLVDRKKDMIIVSGFNVYPNEIEAVLSNHDSILEAAVIGVPHEKTGESVRAYIILKPKKEATPALLEAIKIFCRKHLTAYKNPKEIIFTNQLPKSNVGKILRRELRQQALTEH